MSLSPHGRAVIDEDNPEATALCERCKMLYNRGDLRYQYDWIGQKLQNKRLLVCETCWDEPSVYLKTLILPPDPMPVLDGRILGTPIDFQSHWTLRPPLGYLSMFQAFGDASAALCRVANLVGHDVSFILGGDALGQDSLGGGVEAPKSIQMGGASTATTTVFFDAAIAPSMPSASTASAATTALFLASLVGNLGGVSSVTCALAPSRPAAALLGGMAIGEDSLGGGSSISV